jgi:hypothetical protein
MKCVFRGWIPGPERVRAARKGPSPRSFLASLSHKQRGRGDRWDGTRLVGGCSTTAVLASLVAPARAEAVEQFDGGEMSVHNRSTTKR